MRVLGILVGMPKTRNIIVTLTAVEPVCSETQPGVLLTYRPYRAKLDTEVIEDFADLSLGEQTVPTVNGVGKILRLLRVARLAAPSDPTTLLGKPEEVCDTLERAIGIRFRVKIRSRSRIRFVAWTETGIETVENVTEVIETPGDFFITLQRGRFPLRIPREKVIRHQTEMNYWWEVLSINRL